MALSDLHLAHYEFEENFDEEIHAVNSVPPNANPLGPSPGGLMAVKSVSGKIGKAARFTVADTSNMYHASNAIFDAAGIDKTIAFWFRVNRFIPPNTGNFFSGQYGLQLDHPTRAFRVEGESGTGLTHSKVLEADTWYFIVVTMETTGAQTANLRIRFDDEVPESGTISIAAFGDVQLIGGDFDLDELGFWDRVLTASEMDQLYNDGDGLSYDEIAADGEAAPCRSVECCGDCDF